MACTHTSTSGQGLVRAAQPLGAQLRYAKGEEGCEMRDGRRTREKGERRVREGSE